MLHFTSTLKPEYAEPLEKLLFFNPGQERAYAAIVDSLKLFGKPDIHRDGNKIRINVEKLDEAQNLFTLDEDKLVGVMIYSRVSHEHIAVIHIVVDHDYSSHGKFAEKMLVIRMLDMLRSSARRIKGVNAVCILHGNNRVQQLPV